MSIFEQRVRSAVSERDLAILGLYFYYGYTDTEIGEMLGGVKRKTVAMARFTALKRLNAIYRELMV